MPEGAEPLQRAGGVVYVNSSRGLSQVAGMISARFMLKWGTFNSRLVHSPENERA
jgi:hypothetical protein